MRIYAFALLALISWFATSSELDSKVQLAQAKYANDIQKSALQKFITGKEFCAKYAEQIAKEDGFEVMVPVDYENSKRGKTRIWAFFKSGPFKPELPTVIFLDGGPGGNSHTWPQLLTGYNELHFDQRGIGCSHPESLDLYRDPNFYSNINNVRDMDEIRKFLQIEKFAVYGASYGTALATMYASLYPKHTQSVVVDGVVFSNDDADVIGFYLRKMFRELPVSTQEAMQSYFNEPQLGVSLYMLAKVLMYDVDAFDRMASKLQQIFKSPDQIDKETADKLFKANLMQKAFFNDSIDAVEEFNNQLMNCKAIKQIRTIPLPVFYSPPGVTRRDFNFVTIPYKVTGSANCEAIGALQDNPTFSAADYLFAAPVTYFQGNWDGATLAGEATKHYRTVPQGTKQIFIAKKGGHCPGLHVLMDQSEANKKARAIQVEVTQKALSGQLASSSDLQEMNAGQETDPYPVHWVYTSSALKK